MKKILFIVMLFITATISAQVGIGTTTPNAGLDVTSVDTGVLIPRVALTDTTVQAPVTNPQGGGLAVSTLVYNTNTVNDVTPGFYFWDGTAWSTLSGSVTYAEQFEQTSMLLVDEDDTAFQNVPGLTGINITVPVDGFYQIDFTGFYGVKSIDETGGGQHHTRLCNGEALFRLSVDGTLEDASYVRSTSFKDEDSGGVYYWLSNSTTMNYQVYLTAGAHTIDITFNEIYYAGSCKAYDAMDQTTSSVVGGSYPDGSDNCKLAIHLVKN